MMQPMFLIPVPATIALGNGGIALAGARLSPLKMRSRLALRPAKAGWGALLLLVIGTLGAGMAAINLVQLTGIRANQGSNQVLSTMANQSSPAEFAVLIAVVSLLPAVCEELLFRGYAQTRLVARWGSTWGIAVSALMFGLVHVDPVQTPDMILLGGYLGWAAYRTGSTRTSIICHLINNAVAVALAFVTPRSGKEAAAATTSQKLIMLALGVTVCAVCTWIAGRLVPKQVGSD
jgi:hypothetical protein